METVPSYIARAFAPFAPLKVIPATEVVTAVSAAVNMFFDNSIPFTELVDKEVCTCNGNGHFFLVALE